MCHFHFGVSRTTLWVTWLICTLIATVYAALSLRTFAKVDEAYSDAEEADDQTVAVLVASFAGAAVVVAFSLMSLCLLIGKQMSAKAVGYMYGFVNASALNLALFCLLCGLILTAFEDDMRTSFSKTGTGYSWSDTDTDIFKATYGFAFVATAGYFGLFLVMFLASFTIDRETSLLDEDRA